jgi:hypothetical protein
MKRTREERIADLSATIRSGLAAVPPARQVAVLMEVYREGGMVREAVAPLLRELGVAPDVTPADAPTGRGDEPSPASGPPSPDPHPAA